MTDALVSLIRRTWRLGKGEKKRIVFGTTIIRVGAIQNEEEEGGHMDRS